MARSGEAKSVQEIVAKLRYEGYAHGQVEGRMLRKKLRDIIAEAAASRS